nr:MULTISPECIES: YrzI family small protein [Bacillaceae]
MCLKKAGRRGVTSCGLFMPFFLAKWICLEYGEDVAGLKRRDQLKEVVDMTLNILFFSITIKKRKMSLEEAVQQEMVEKLYDEAKERQISMHHFM